MKLTLIFAFLIIICSNQTFAVDDAHLKVCQNKLKKLQKLDVLENIKVQQGYFDVVVGPTFYSIPFDSKEAFAETLNCVFNVGETGPKSFCYEIHFVNWRTGNDDGKYSLCKLKIY